MDSPVEQVRAGVDIVDLVAQYVPTLRKAGRTYKALCPFHTEKTPSFVVFPDTGRWHCFGCGEGGDIFSFVMKVENLTFPEALRRLADRIGVVVTVSREPEESREAKARFYAANEAAAVLYHGLLVGSQPVRRYVADRGITEETMREFLLGMAPDSTDAVQRQLLRQGFTAEELLQAGLLYEPEDGPPRDRYRGRLMFPIRDAGGHIVSFGARALGDAQPKYLNGPQTDIFDKGGTLYGLYAATQAIRKEQRAVVVEGYVDVVVAHQGGFRNVVATLGTAITDRHLRQLARLAPEICLALDPDPAGETAALRGAEVARSSLADTVVPVPTWRGLVRYEAGSRASITVAVLPHGLDPDELILKDSQRWRAVVAQAQPVVDHAIHWVAGRYDLSTARGKAEAVEALLPLLLDVADPIRRSHYVEMAAQELRLDSAALAERTRQYRAGVGGRGSAVGRGGRSGLGGRPGLSSLQPPAPGPQPPTSSEQHYAIALLVAAAQRGLTQVDFDPADFSDPSARALLLHIQDVLRSDLRSEWRPDLLHSVAAPWLEGPAARVREALEDVGRLADSQLAGAWPSMARQLRDARLALELPELVGLAQDSDPEELARLKIRIAEINRERASLRREDADQPRGPAAIGRRVAAVPARFRVAAGVAPPPQPSPVEGEGVPDSPPFFAGEGEGGGTFPAPE